MKVSIFSFLILFGLVFTSCLKNDDNLTDDALIAAIQTATDKEVVNTANLPTSSFEVLSEEFSESFIENASLAPTLGYEVRVQREFGAFMGERNLVYFDLEGRELRPRAFRGPRGRGQGGCDRNECFDILFPVTFIMPDESTVTGDSRQEVGMAMGEMVFVLLMMAVKSFWIFIDDGPGSGDRHEESEWSKRGDFHCRSTFRLCMFLCV